MIALHVSVVKISPPTINSLIQESGVATSNNKERCAGVNFRTCIFLSATISLINNSGFELL